MSDDQDNSSNDQSQDSGDLISSLFDSAEEKVGGKDSLLGGVLEAVKKNLAPNTGGSNNDDDQDSDDSDDDQDSDDSNDSNDSDDSDDSDDAKS